MKTYELKLAALSIEAMLNDEEKSYNQSEWVKMVKRYSEYKDCQFYVSPAGVCGNDYRQHYAVYTLPEGLKVFKKVGYHSCLSSNSFRMVMIGPENGNIIVLGFGPEGDRGIINNKQGRKWMSDNSTKFGNIFTTDF